VTRKPIPVARLVQQVCDDGSDYDDGVFGYCSGRFDEATDVLTLTFKCCDEDGGNPDDEDFASAEYHFQLISGETL